MMGGRSIEEARSIEATRNACGFKAEAPLTDAPEPLAMSRAEWESLSPGYRREIERDLRKRGMFPEFS